MTRIRVRESIRTSADRESLRAAAVAVLEAAGARISRSSTRERVRASLGDLPGDISWGYELTPQERWPIDVTVTFGDDGGFRLALLDLEANGPTWAESGVYWEKVRHRCAVVAAALSRDLLPRLPDASAMSPVALYDEEAGGLTAMPLVVDPAELPTGSLVTPTVSAKQVRRTRWLWLVGTLVVLFVFYGPGVDLASMALDAIVGGSDPAASPSPSASIGPLATPDPPVDCRELPSYPHDDPALEALLPASVAGRPLTRWSMGGWCLLGNSLGLTQAEVEARLREEAPGVDPAHLALAIAGRSDVETDPPFFVFAARLPADDDERWLGAVAIFRAANYLDPEDPPEDDAYEDATIGGKAVGVGTAAMLRQTAHIRGRPYLYRSGEIAFIVVTDDPAWAADALARLP